MMSGEFERNLRKLNHNLRIFCGDDDNKPAGIHILTHDGWEQLMGCDKSWVSERAEFDIYGHMLRSGWRRVLQWLIKNDYVDRRHAERVFHAHLPYAKKIAVPTRELKHDLIDKYRVDGKRSF